MSEAVITQLAAQMMWLVLLSLPVVVASVVGILVRLVQALTQVQDQTIQFLINYATQNFNQIGRMGP